RRTSGGRADKELTMATRKKTKAAKVAKRGKVAKRATRKASSRSQAGPAVDAEPRDWRARTLERVRKLLTAADPDLVEEVKWRKPSNAMRGMPVWSHGGIVCTGETYKDKVKLTFAKGAALPDPEGLFNASLTGGTRRAIDIREGDTIDAAAL